MRPARLAAACALAAVAATAQTADLSVEDTDRRFASLGLQVRAEKVVHRGATLLLVRIDATGNRLTGSLSDGNLAFLPVSIACAHMVLQAGGVSHKPHAASPCVVSEKLAHPKALPVFVAFALPAGAREGRVTVPLTVLEPVPPILTSLRPSPSARGPSVDSALLGAHELTLRVQLDR